MARILHLYRNSQPEGGEEAVSRRELIRRKYWQLWEQYQSDPEYARMYRKMDRLEWEFEEVTGWCMVWLPTMCPSSTIRRVRSAFFSI